MDRSRALPALSELLRLGQADLYRLTGAPPRAASGFGPDSAPYLWASEFPAAVLVGLGLRPPVLCVAGSGDNAAELLRLGLWPCLAVDVSRAACYVNELKAAALASGLARDDYLGLLPAPKPELLKRLAPKLSAEALAFWRRAAERGGVEPASLLDREPYLDGLPYLATEAAYGQTLEAARPWPLLNLSLEDFLGRSSEPFGTIYVSNVGEYIRRELLLGGQEDEVEGRLAEFYRLVASRLLKGGLALAYLFEGQEKALAGAEARAMAAAGLEVRGYPVEFRRFGTLFRHGLLAGRRAYLSSLNTLFTGLRLRMAGQEGQGSGPRMAYDQRPAKLATLYALKAGRACVSSLAWEALAPAVASPPARALRRLSLLKCPSLALRPGQGPSSQGHSAVEVAGTRRASPGWRDETRESSTRYPPVAGH